MRKIYIVDLIGSYCGMHYYDDAFAQILRDSSFDVEILSNFNKKKTPFFPVIFGRNKFVSVLLLVVSCIRFYLHILTHRKGVYIYMCYGEFYDILMMIPNTFCDRMFCDVHEVHALKYADDSKVSKFFSWFYVKFVKNFIYHSERTKKILSDLNVSVPMLYVPHFKYNFKKNYEMNKIGLDVAKCFNTQRKKFLFFGNLSYAKGVDIAVKVFQCLNDFEKDNVELVIAGKNVDKIDFSQLRQMSENFYVIDRHINDDELVYLYSKTDYVLLPYRKSSQSGIMAMACYFKKPMLMTDIEYFRNTINEFPSFGVIASIDEYQNLVCSVINGEKVMAYYNYDDCCRFEQKKDIELFVGSFKSVVDKRSHL